MTVLHVRLGENDPFPHPDMFFIGRGDAVTVHISRSNLRSVESFTITRDGDVGDSFVYGTGECGCR